MYHKVFTKMSDEEIVILNALAADAGFRSTYELIQALLRLFIRNAVANRKRKKEEKARYSINADIAEMFDHLQVPPAKEKTVRRKGDEKDY